MHSHLFVFSLFSQVKEEPQGLAPSSSYTVAENSCHDDKTFHQVLQKKQDSNKLFSAYILSYPEKVDIGF